MTTPSEPAPAVVDLGPPQRKRKFRQETPPLDWESSAVLQKGWEFVREVEQEAFGRTLAPLTGSRLEAQLLVSLIESMPPADEEETEAEPACLERSLSGLEPLPEPLPGISEQEWEQFKRRVYG